MITNKKRGVVTMFTFLLLLVLFINLISATNIIETKTDFVKQGDPYIVKQFCVNSTYANISFIKLASENILGQTQMIEVSDDSYQYNFTNTSILGIYSLVSYCDENGIKIGGGQDFEITTNGKNLETQKTTVQSLLVPSAGAIIALILVAISFAVSNDITKKSLKYAGIIMAAFNLYLCFYLGANNLLSIFSAGIIAIGVGSLFEDD